MVHLALISEAGFAEIEFGYHVASGEQSSWRRR